MSRRGMGALVVVALIVGATLAAALWRPTGPELSAGNADVGAVDLATTDAVEPVAHAPSVLAAPPPAPTRPAAQAVLAKLQVAPRQAAQDWPTQFADLASFEGEVVRRGLQRSADDAADRAEEKADGLLATWDAEEPNPRATQELSRHFQGAIEDLAVPAQLDELLCKKTLCRVRMRFDQLEDALQFEQESGFPERRKRLDITTVGAGMSVEVFLGRE